MKLFWSTNYIIRVHEIFWAVTSSIVRKETKGTKSKFHVTMPKPHIETRSVDQTDFSMHGIYFVVV